MWKKDTRCGYYLVEAALVLGKTQTGKALQNYNASRDNMYDLVPVVYFERARGTSRERCPRRRLEPHIEAFAFPRQVSYGR